MPPSLLRSISFMRWFLSADGIRMSNWMRTKMRRPASSSPWKLPWPARRRSDVDSCCRKGGRRREAGGLATILSAFHDQLRAVGVFNHPLRPRRVTVRSESLRTSGNR